jgi:hypothetical protein
MDFLAKKVLVSSPNEITSADAADCLSSNLTRLLLLAIFFGVIFGKKDDKKQDARATSARNANRPPPTTYAMVALARSGPFFAAFSLS